MNVCTLSCPTLTGISESRASRFMMGLESRSLAFHYLLRVGLSPYLMCCNKEYQIIAPNSTHVMAITC